MQHACRVSDLGASPVETVQLPLSGVRLMWHRSGFWRIVLPDQWADEQTGQWLPDVTDWDRWTGLNTNVVRGEYPPGNAQRPTWWPACGELPSVGASVHVALADLTEPPVETVGLVWGCEWAGDYQQATVRVGDDQWTTARREMLNPAGLRMSTETKG